MDCSLPGSSVHGYSQARILEKVAICFSRGSSWTKDQTHVLCIGRQILYHWATWEAHVLFRYLIFLCITINTICFVCIYVHMWEGVRERSYCLGLCAGTGEPGGLPSMGSHRVRHDWSDLAAALLYYKRPGVRDDFASFVHKWNPVLNTVLHSYG